MRRALHERARWLAAVLIVTAIAAVSAAILRWPLPAPPAVPRPASSAPRLVDPLRLPRHPAPRVSELVVTTRTPRAADLSPRRARVTPHATAIDVRTTSTPVEVPAPGLSVAPRTAERPPPVPLLASRRLHIPAVVPAIRAADLPLPAAATASPHGLVDMPVLAVTRVVSVAGRGLRSGLRATTAVLRAAF